MCYILTMIIYISCVCGIFVHSLYTEVIHSPVSTEILGVLTSIVDIMVHYYQNSVTIFM